MDASLVAEATVVEGEAVAIQMVVAVATAMEIKKDAADGVAEAGAEAPRLVDDDSQQSAAALEGGQGSRGNCAGTVLVTPRVHGCPSRRNPRL